MTVSAAAANFTRNINVAATSATITLPTAVPAGATIVVGAVNRTDTTTDITGASDGTNGAYTSGSLVDSHGGRLFYFNNAAAATPTITVTFAGSIASQLMCGWIQSTLGAMTFDVAATVRVAGANETAVSSNTLAAAGAGAIIGWAHSNNAQTDPEPTADGAGESELLAGLTGLRQGTFFEAYAAAGTYGFVTTWDSATTKFHVIAFLEAAGGTTYTKTQSDALVLADALVTSALRGRTVTDNIDPVDAVLRYLLRSRMTEDEVQVLDSFIKQIILGAGAVHTLVMDDGIAFFDELRRELLRLRVVGDSVVITDTTATMRLRNKHLAEALNVADNFSLGRVTGRVISEGVQLIDELTTNRLRSRMVGDSVTLADELLPYRLVNRLLTELLVIGDEFSKTVGTFANISVLTLSDTIALTDALLSHRRVTRLADDPITVRDEVVASALHHRQFSDALVLSDGALVSRGWVRQVSDNLGLTDGQLHSLLRVLTVGEQISVDDGVLSFRLLARDLVDALAMNDDYSKVITGFITPLTVEVRIRLGMRYTIELGQSTHRLPRLGVVSEIKLGGYN